MSVENILIIFDLTLTFWKTKNWSSAETEDFATSGSDLVPIDTAKKIIDQILRYEKVLSAKWLSYFNSTAFAILEDVIYKEPLKWFPLLIFCSVLFF